MKIKISNSGNPVSSYHCEVRINDLNYGKHVGHQTIYEYCHDARIKFIESLGTKLGQTINEVNFGKSGLVMSHSAAQYISELRYPNLIEVETFLEEVSPMRFTLTYLIQTQSKQVIAKAQTIMVCFDYEQSKATKMDSEIFEHLNQIIESHHV